MTRKSLILTVYVLLPIFVAAGPLHGLTIEPTLEAGTASSQTQTAAPAQIATPENKSPNTGPALEDGTPVKLRLGRAVSSADAKVGDQVDFDVQEDVKVGDLVVISKGSVAFGTVTVAVPKRRMGRTGKVDIKIETVRLVNLDKAPLRAEKGGQGGGHVGSMVVGMAAASVLFFPAAPLFLMMHGKDITIPKGTEVTAYVDGRLNFDPAKMTSAMLPTGSPAQPLAVVSAQKAVVEPCAVVVKSTPDGAEITVDGAFAGSTPSTLKLTPGGHEIAVQKTGFKAWKRSVTLTTAGSVTLDATLEKEQ
jgi:hypothetical protein